MSELCQAGYEKDLPVVEEIFADRAYLDDGNLVPRSRPDAMIHGAEASLAHVTAMLDQQALISVTGKRLPATIGSIRFLATARTRCARPAFYARSCFTGATGWWRWMRSIPPRTAARRSGAWR